MHGSASSRTRRICSFGPPSVLWIAPGSVHRPGRPLLLRILQENAAESRAARPAWPGAQCRSPSGSAPRSVRRPAISTATLRSDGQGVDIGGPGLIVDVCSASRTRMKSKPACPSLKALVRQRDVLPGPRQNLPEVIDLVPALWILLKEVASWSARASCSALVFLLLLPERAPALSDVAPVAIEQGDRGRDQRAYLVEVLDVIALDHHLGGDVGDHQPLLKLNLELRILEPGVLRRRTGLSVSSRSRLCSQSN